MKGTWNCFVKGVPKGRQGMEDTHSLHQLFIHNSTKRSLKGSVAGKKVRKAHTSHSSIWEYQHGWLQVRGENGSCKGGRKMSPRTPARGSRSPPAGRVRNTPFCEHCLLSPPPPPARLDTRGLPVGRAFVPGLASHSTRSL